MVGGQEDFRGSVVAEGGVDEVLERDGVFQGREAEVGGAGGHVGRVRSQVMFNWGMEEERVW